MSNLTEKEDLDHLLSYPIQRCIDFNLDPQGDFTLFTPWGYYLPNLQE